MVEHGITENKQRTILEFGGGGVIVKPGVCEEKSTYLADADGKFML